MHSKQQGLQRIMLQNIPLRQEDPDSVFDWEQQVLQESINAMLLRPFIGLAVSVNYGVPIIAPSGVAGRLSASGLHRANYSVQ